MATHLSPDTLRAFAKCGAFYRDTLLPPHFFSAYRIGRMIREPTFCDSTYRFGGFAAPHRYLIFSANARCIDDYSQHPEWGLCIWVPGRLFKVIGLHRSPQYSQVTLLEIPEELWQEFSTFELSSMEQQFADIAAEQFQAAHHLHPLREHQTRLWLDRLELPIGMDDQGQFFEL